MADLQDDIAAFNLMRVELETHHLGKWALVHDRELIAVFDEFDNAAIEAVRQFGRGPYLIRQIGTAPITLSAATLYHPVHA
jgi:hypothetical protein